MRRRLLNLLTGVSLLLCVAALMMWVRSDWVEDRLTWNWSNMQSDVAPEDYLYWEERTVACRRGAVLIRWQRAELNSYAGPQRPPNGFSYERHSPPRESSQAALRWRPPGTWFDHSAAGFDLYAAQEGMTPAAASWRRQWWRGWSLFIPLYALVMATAVVPVLRGAVTMAKGTRGVAASCKSCGYDLRATPDTCPECGTPAAGGTIGGR